MSGGRPLAARESLSPVPSASRAAAKARAGLSGPVHVHLEVSSTCHASCLYCPSEQRKGGMLAAGRATTWLGAWAQHGVTSVTLHGFGEPLLNPEFVPIARFAAARGISYEFATNGALLGRYAPALASVPPARVAVSVDSVDPLVAAAVRRGVALAEVLRGIRVARRRLKGTRLEIWATVTRHSVAGLPDLAEAAGSLGVDALVLQPVHGPSAQVLGADPGTLEEVLPHVAAVAERAGLEVDQSRVSASRVIRCTYSDVAVYVRLHGSVLPCCNWDPGAPVACLDESGSLAEVWAGPLAAIRASLASNHWLAGCAGCRPAYRGSSG